MNFKLKDIIEMPKGIWSWDLIKEMTLYDLENIDEWELFRIKNFSRKSYNKLKEALSEWISLLGYDIQITVMEKTQDADIKTVRIYHKCKLIDSMQIDCYRLLRSIMDMIKYRKEVTKPYIDPDVIIAIIHYLTKKELQQ